MYRFIHAWVPALYGELDENYWQERGYILFDTDTDMSPEMSPQETADNSGDDKKSPIDGDDITDLTRESWEVSLTNFQSIIIIRKKYLVKR